MDNDQNSQLMVKNWPADSAMYQCQELFGRLRITNLSQFNYVLTHNPKGRILYWDNASCNNNSKLKDWIPFMWGEYLSVPHK